MPEIENMHFHFHAISSWGTYHGWKSVLKHFYNKMLYNYCSKKKFGAIRSVRKITLYHLLVDIWILVHYSTPLSVYSNLFNRPGVAGAVLQTPPLLINSLIMSSFCSESSRHCLSQTVKARELNFWGNVDLPPCVICHVSHVRYHMSHVACNFI